jgi:predicted nucleic acid-binding Zn ribbon protein
MQATEDDGDDDDGPAADAADVEFESDDDEIVTVACPHCRKPIWEESVACEHCGNYLSKEDEPGSRPWWLVLGGLAGLFVIDLWIRYFH